MVAPDDQPDEESNPAPAPMGRREQHGRAIDDATELARYRFRMGAVASLFNLIAIGILLSADKRGESLGEHPVLLGLTFGLFIAAGIIFAMCMRAQSARK